MQGLELLVSEQIEKHIVELVNKQAKDYIFVALDFDNAEDAVRMAELLEDEIGGIKLGMEIRAVEPDILRLMPLKLKKFWDQKLHDIPNSVAGASRATVKDGVLMFNLMAMGGTEMMKAAVNAVHEEAKNLGVKRPLIIAVTLLTSIDQKTLNEDLKIPMTTEECVVHLAKLAKEAGLDGVVASPKDTAMIRKACGSNFVIINPGIRPAGSDIGDQKRVGTPGDAIINGADYLVVGRPITQAEDPVEATRAIVEEIESTLLYRNTALRVFNDKGIEFGAFKLKSHKRWPGAPDSPIFVNLRQIGSSQEHEGKLTPETIDKIGQLIVDRYGELIAKQDFIAGIPSAAEPIVDAIYKHLPKDTKVRRLHLEKIGTGEKRMIDLKEGETYTPGAKVLLVDDLITKADSKIEAAAALRNIGMIVEECLVVVDRQQGGPEEAEKDGLKIISIYTLDNLLDIYQNSGLISQEKIDEVKSYKQRFEEYTTNNPPIES